MAYRKTNDEFLKEISAFDDFNEYEVLDKYTKSNIKIRFKHLKCGSIFSMTPSCFLKGQRCPECGQKKARLNRIKHSREKFVSKFNNVSNGEYVLLGTYKTSTDKIEFKHLSCGKKFLMSPHHFIDDNARCPFCFGTPRKTLDEFKNQVSHLYGTRYTILANKYVNTETHIKCMCNVCKSIWYPTPANLLHGYGCPVCNYSKGERFIKQILDCHDIYYKSPMLFNDLLDQNKLRYDFYLSDQNVLIEYQGKQHYEPVNFHGALSKIQQDNNFIKQQKHDQMKREYAREHGYKLIEIPYTCNSYKDIENIIINNVENPK